MIIFVVNNVTKQKSNEGMKWKQWEDAVSQWTIHSSQYSAPLSQPLTSSCSVSSSLSASRRFLAFSSSWVDFPPSPSCSVSVLISPESVLFSRRALSTASTCTVKRADTEASETSISSTATFWACRTNRANCNILVNYIPVHINTCDEEWTQKMTLMKTMNKFWEHSLVLHSHLGRFIREIYPGQINAND